MWDIIFLIILIASLVGIGLVLRKKVPILKQLPKIHEGIQKENKLAAFWKKIKVLPVYKIIALKFLSKTRVFILKLEKHLDNLLQKTRKKMHAQNQLKKGAQETKVEITKIKINQPPTPPSSL